MTDILIESFAKGRGKERQRAVIRFIVRSGTGAISSMLAIIYLRRESRRFAGCPIFTIAILRYNVHSPAIDSHKPAPYTDICLVNYCYRLFWSVICPMRGHLAPGESCMQLGCLRALLRCMLGCTIYAHIHGLLEAETGWLGPVTRGKE